MNSEILNKTNEYYTEKIQRYGNTNLGVDWNSVESQELRFEQTSKIIRNTHQRVTICDYGCGYGAYYDYLKRNGYDINYTGIDISSKMIENAIKNHDKCVDAHFAQGSDLTQKFDYIVSSGIFNVKQGVTSEEWKEYIYEVINIFDKYSIKGFSFNCLTKYSDKEYMKDYLYYADPLEIFDYLKRKCSLNVALLHDYNLYEFTMLVRK